MTTRKMKLWAALAVIGIVLGASQTAFAQGGAEQKQQSLYDRLGGLVPITPEHKGAGVGSHGHHLQGDTRQASRPREGDSGAS
jgi:hypothetical protein